MILSSVIVGRSACGRPPTIHGGDRDESARQRPSLPPGGSCHGVALKSRPMTERVKKASLRLPCPVRDGGAVGVSRLRGHFPPPTRLCRATSPIWLTPNRGGLSSLTVWRAAAFAAALLGHFRGKKIGASRKYMHVIARGRSPRGNPVDRRKHPFNRKKIYGIATSGYALLAMTW